MPAQTQFQKDIVFLSAAEIAAFPTLDPQYTQNYNAEFVLNVAPFTRYYNNGGNLAQVAAGGTGLNAPQTPVGTINGVNTVFTITGSISLLFLNGVYQTAGGVDYTLVGTTITYVTAPQIGDAHVAL